MATKAEVMAAIEKIGQAVQAAAEVATKLEGEVTKPPPVVEPPPPPANTVTITPMTGGTLHIAGSADIKTATWSLVRNTEPDYQWYGQVSTVSLPATITPQYSRDGDFVKVMYGDGKWVDGPKDTKAVVPAIPIGGTGPAAFIRNWTVNMNIERLRPLTMSYQGTPLTREPYYRYLASLGITGVRFFIPYRHDRDMGIGTGVPSVGSWDGLLDASQAAIMAGLSVMLGVTDVVGEGPINFNNWKTHADNVAKRVAERGLQPDKFAIEVANELAQYDNNHWNAMRLEIHNILRRRLPNHVIVHGCSGWNGINDWNDQWVPPSDGNILLQYHDYGWRSAADWSGVATRLNAFARKHGTYMVCGEQGDQFDMASANNIGRWMDNFRNYARGAGSLRLCPWTVTDGSTFRLNRSSSDPALVPQFENAMVDMINMVKQSPGWAV